MTPPYRPVALVENVERLLRAQMAPPPSRLDACPTGQVGRRDVGDGRALVAHECLEVHRVTPKPKRAARLSDVDAQRGQARTSALRRTSRRVPVLSRGARRSSQASVSM